MKSPSARLYALPGHGRVGIATAKAIGCHARRNRQKRRFGEALRSSNAELSGMDAVFIVSKNAEQAKLTEIAKQIQEMVRTVERRWAEK